jgi:hypothetical protein
MKSRHLILGLLVAAVALYFTFREASFQQICRSLLEVKYGYLLGSLVLFFAAFSTRALRWHYFCKAVKTVPTRRLFSPMMIGFMGNLLPLRAGEFIRAYLLGRRESISFSASLATIVVERMFDLLSVLVLFGCLLVWNPIVFVPHGGENDPGQVARYVRTFGVVSLVGVLGLAAFLYLLIHQEERGIGLVRRATRALPLRLQTRIEDILRSFTAGLGILKDPRGILVTVLLSALLWILLCLSNVPFYWAYQIESDLPLDSVVTLMVVTCVLISVMPTPGYLGPFQFAMTFVLADLYGVDRAVAVSFSMVNWFVSMGVIFLVGVFFLFRDNLSFFEVFRKAHEISRTSTEGTKAGGDGFEDSA